MKKKYLWKVLFPFAVSALLCLALAACGGDLLGGGGDDSPSIPEGVANLAGGIFETIGLVFESESSDPTLGTYPAGMSVTWVTPGTVLKITFTNYSPDTGVMVNGSVTLTQTSGNPLTMTFSGSMTITGLEYSSVSLSGTAVWPAGAADPGDADPESVTGTFTVDGKSYSLADVLAAAEDDDDDGGGGTTTPISVTPLPATFMTSLGNFSQSFDDRVWRSSSSPAWADYNYMRFSIGANGDVYAVYLSGTEADAGYINWHTSGGVQKLDFLNSSKTQVLYSFTVLDYSASHLQLSCQWENETKEWIFSAGTRNFSGVVSDASTANPITNMYGTTYTYYTPVAGATVTLGRMDPSFTPTGLTTTTDSRGYFEFAGLASYVNSNMGVRITKTGYLTYESPISEGIVTDYEALFKFLKLTPAP